MYLFTLYINTWYTLLKVYLKIGLSFQSKKPFINFVNHTAPRILIMQNFKIHNLCFEKKQSVLLNQKFSYQAKIITIIYMKKVNR